MRCPFSKTNQIEIGFHNGLQGLKGKCRNNSCFQRWNITTDKSYKKQRHVFGPRDTHQAKVTRNARAHFNIYMWYLSLLKYCKISRYNLHMQNMTWQYKPLLRNFQTCSSKPAYVFHRREKSPHMECDSSWERIRPPLARVSLSLRACAF